MNKIQILRITNNLILLLSLIAYLYLWKDLQEWKSQDLKGLELYKIPTDLYILNYSTIIVGLISSIFLWLFISTFCDNAEDSKVILSYLKKKNIKSKKIKKDEKIANEIVDIDGIKQSLSPDELIVKVKKSGKIEKIKKRDWDDIVKIGNKDMFEIKFKNE